MSTEWTNESINQSSAYKSTTLDGKVLRNREQKLLTFESLLSGAESGTKYVLNVDES